MTSANILHIVTSLLKFLSAAIMLLGSPAVNQLPPQWVAYGAIALAVVSGAKDALIWLGDLLDDGKIDGSFVVKVIAAAGLSIGAISLTPSCSLTTAFLATSAGQSMVLTAEAAAKQLVTTTEIAGLGVLADSVAAQIISINAQPASPVNIVELANLRDVLLQTLDKYRSLAGKPYTSAKVSEALSTASGK